MDMATSGGLVVTPHPLTLEGQEFLPCDVRPGENLRSFLARHVDLQEKWEIRIGGHLVPEDHWDRVRPKNRALIEVRGIVKKQVLYAVAMAALIYFTMGAGATWAAGFGLSAAATSMVYAVAFIGGSAHCGMQIR